MKTLKAILYFFMEMRFYFYDPLIKAEKNDGILELHYKSGRIKRYTGYCTVWYTYPYMQRCGTFTEADLSDIDEYIKCHGNPYPTAHKKKHPQIIAGSFSKECTTENDLKAK